MSGRPAVALRNNGTISIHCQSDDMTRQGLADLLVVLTQVYAFSGMPQRIPNAMRNDEARRHVDPSRNRCACLLCRSVAALNKRGEDDHA